MTIVFNGFWSHFFTFAHMHASNSNQLLSFTYVETVSYVLSYSTLQPNRTYYLDDPEGYAIQWVEAIDNMSKLSYGDATDVTSSTTGGASDAAAATSTTASISSFACSTGGSSNSLAIVNTNSPASNNSSPTARRSSPAQRQQMETTIPAAAPTTVRGKKTASN